MQSGTSLLLEDQQSGLGEEVVWRCSNIIQIVIPMAKGHTRLVKDISMMLYTKYESSGSCACRQHFKKMQYATNRNHLNNFTIEKGTFYK